MIHEKQSEAFEMILRNQPEGIKILRELYNQYPNMPDSLKGAHFNSFGVYYAVKGQLDSAIVKFQEAVKYYKDHPGALRSFTNLGLAYRNTGENRKALETLFEALEQAQKLRSDEMVSKICSEIGTVYNQLGFVSTSLEYTLKALRLLELMPDASEKDLMLAKQKLATKYTALGQHHKSISIFKEVLFYFKENELWYAYYPSLISLIDAYYLIGNIEATQEWIDKNEADVMANANIQFQNLFNRSKGKTYFALNKKQEAKEILLSVFLSELKKPHGFTLDAAVDYLKLLIADFELEKAEAFIDKYILELENIESSYLIKEKFYEYCSEIYGRRGQFELSHLYARNALRARDSVSRYENEMLANFHPLAFEHQKLLEEYIHMEDRVAVSKKVLYGGLGLLALTLLGLFIWLKAKVKNVKRNILRGSNSFEFDEQKSLYQLAIQEKAQLERKITSLEKELTVYKNNNEAVNDETTDIILDENIDIYEYIGETITELTQSEKLICEYLIRGFSKKEIIQKLKVSSKNLSDKKNRIAKKIKDFYYDDLEEYISIRRNELREDT